MFNQMARLGLSQKSHSSLFSQGVQTLKRKITGKRGFSNGYGFKENPIIFNKINENYVIKGKEKIIGWWLMSVSASVFGLILLGGYTRLTRSGLSMVKWHPHKVGLPKGQAEWEKEFEEYKQFPEYYLINKQKGMDLEGFKQIYFIEWAHRILARSIGGIFMGPLAYFWYRGYL
jgi:cytochrome c oxidase assembly protein subunit 15